MRQALSPESAERHDALRRRLARSHDIADAYPIDAALLTALTQIVAESAFRQRVARGLFCTLAPFGALLGLLLCGEAPWLGASLAVGSLALPLFVQRAARVDVHDNALRTTRFSLLPHATPDMVPALLTLGDALSDRFVYPKQSFGGEMAALVYAALARQLPRFHDAASLNASQRSALRALALWYQRTAPERTVAALLVLGEARDPSLAPFARHWVRHHADEGVREAAAEYLSAVEKAP